MGSKEFQQILGTRTKSRKTLSSTPVLPRLLLPPFFGAQDLEADLKSKGGYHYTIIS